MQQKEAIMKATQQKVEKTEKMHYRKLEIYRQQLQQELDIKLKIERDKLKQQKKQQTDNLKQYEIQLKAEMNHILSMYAIYLH